MAKDFPGIVLHNSGLTIGTSAVTTDNIVIKDDVGRMIILSEDQLYDLHALIGVFQESYIGKLNPSNGHVMIDGEEHDIKWLDEMLERKRKDIVEEQRPNISFEEEGFDD
jgi:hypothetical protein